VVANHQNALVDPIVVFRAAGRSTRPLAKATLFDHRLLGPVLRALGGLPVYRRQDDASQMHRNEDTFRAAIQALKAGDALQIYPEGKSHSGPGLEPLRTGAARIALAAEAEAGGRLGLRIAPIGLVWERKHLFRGRVLADIGDPFLVAGWLTPAGAEDAQAVRALTEEIAVRLREVTLNLGAHDDLDLITAADRIYSREKRLHAPRERDPLSRRIPRLRVFVEALEWLREREPETYRTLAQKVQRVDAVSRVLGAEEGGVPRRFPFAAVARYTLREGVSLALALPLAIVGTAIWYPALLVPRWVVQRLNPAHESLATYKIATGFLSVFFTLVFASLIGFVVWGRVGLALAAVGAPVVGLVALAWQERLGRVREDAAVFLRVLTRPRLRRRLASQRAKLAREFDDVQRRMGR
jgi:1-acyl-sn-glycerol-3-phosphate acyltransferase